MDEKIGLGDRVKDKISSLTGVVVCITDWLYGCRRFGVQPEKSKDGKPADIFTVDEPQLVLLKKGIIANAKEEKEKTYGYRPPPSVKALPKRY